MKARIKKTGEIVDVITYNQCSTIRSSQDFVSYIDSKGVEHDRESLNYYWDFESIEADVINNEHWNDVRERAAIAAMQGTITMLSSNDRYTFRYVVAGGFRGDKHAYPNEIAEFAVACANALIEELKKK